MDHGEATDRAAETDRERTWSKLFDLTCKRRGYADDAKLAQELCRLQGDAKASAFEAMKKNVRNWRSGKHLPGIKGEKLLRSLFNVDREQALAADWDRLLAAERAARGSIEILAQLPAKVGIEIARPVLVAISIGIVAILAAVGYLIIASGADGPRFAAAAYKETVRLHVGQSDIVHGARSDTCTGAVPDWRDLEPTLPRPTLGTLSDGGIGERHSKACDGIVKARAIRFTAVKVGTETLSLFDDPISIVVE